jgi:predicted DNA-binding protein YlxM (UPF0122 family)
MTLITDINSLKSITSNFSYKSNGDFHEIQSGHLITDLFPNSEIFWKSFITPLTNRVDPSFTNHDDKIRTRLNISTDIVDLSIIHYSVFLNLVYASTCLTTKQLSYFENFYAHLGSVCDLAEEFVTSLYFVTLECEEKETEILQNLSKTKYLKLARDWYDKHYSNAFTHYLSKGKTAPFKILGRTNIIDEYFEGEKAWKDYFKLAQQLRTYRNVIVHNTQIGSQITPQGIFVPKISRIGDYKKWHQVFDVKKDKFEKDFIERDSQMTQDLNDLKVALNNLWLKPFQHFDRLMYSDLNPRLLKKYDIENNGLEKRP